MELNNIKHEKAKEFLERPPSWLTKWGIYIFIFVFVSFLSFASLFTVVEKTRFDGLVKFGPAEFLITLPREGWYKMVVKERDSVKAKEIIAYPKVGFSYVEFLELKQFMKKLSDRKIIKLQQFTDLGELQQSYDDFLLLSYNLFDSSDSLIKWSLAKNRFLSKLEEFEHDNIIYAPCDGLVTLNNIHESFYGNKFQNVGEIIPSDFRPMIKLTIPIEDISKIALNQKVIIKLKDNTVSKYNNFTGFVSFISWKPNDGKYGVEVSVDKGISSNSFKKIQFYPKMNCSIEIIKNNETLLTKLINKTKML
ncbi:HlyD family secretion protein [Sphingobacterium ginsenosidimutans]